MMTRRTFRPCRIHHLALSAILALSGAVLLSRAGLTAPASYESPRAYCVRVGTDDTLRTPPSSLAPAFRRLFNIRGHYAPNAAYYRCVDGMVKVCFVGANLPCGKANTSKNQLAVARWCETHPETDQFRFTSPAMTRSILALRRSQGRDRRAGRHAATAEDFLKEYWKMVK